MLSRFEAADSPHPCVIICCVIVCEDILIFSKADVTSIRILGGLKIATECSRELSILFAMRNLSTEAALEGNRKGNLCTLSRNRIDINRTAKLFHQLTANSQTQADTLRGDHSLLLLLADCSEELKELQNEGFLHPDSRIFDLGDKKSTFGASAD